jgi:hypothetical protein
VKENSTDPLPCPFCGSARLENFDGNFLKCIDCSAAGPPGSGFIDRWNVRVETPRVHWRKLGEGASVWCGFEGMSEEPPALNARNVTCVQCLRQAYGELNDRAEVMSQTLLYVDHRELPPQKPAADLHVRAGTTVQCGPLTLNIPPGYLCDAAQGKLYVRSPDGKAVWTREHVTAGQVFPPAFSFST